jgi:type I restriction enzyme S subunit
MKQEQLANLSIEWKRGSGFTKSDLDEDGKNKCILYGELYTKHKKVLIESRKISKTNKTGNISSKKGDILIPGTSTASKKDMLLAREIDEDGVFLGGDINIIRPTKGLFAKKYLPYFFETFTAYDQLDRYITGATGIIHISNSGIKNLTIPLPPLPEQQRIVSILDEAFAAIAKAKANAEQNLKNAKELFKSYLQGVFENKGDGWEEKRFDEICFLQRGFDLPTHSRNEGSHPLVSSNGITDRIDLWKVKAPGVVTGRSGTIGNVHYIEEDYWPLNTTLFIKEFHSNFERFIYFFLKQFDLGKYSSGAGVPTLNRNNVHSEMVWFPKSIKEQQTIVQKLDALSAETKKLEVIYQQKINDLEELKKSVLQKAFSGELKVSELGFDGL